MGFGEFTEEAAELEQNALDGRALAIPMRLELLQQMQQRIELDGVTADEEPLEQVETIPAETATPETAPQESSAAVSESSEPIVSSLEGPQFAAIIQKFADSLEDQLTDMHQALLAGDFEALAGLAHRLRGSAGSVGFSAFTEPSTELEAAARECQGAAAAEHLTTLIELRNRIEVADAEDTVMQKTGTIEAS